MTTKRTKRPKLRPISTGIAGEYLVAAELIRLGYVASLTLKNTKGVDVLAASADGRRQVAIQVKTSQGTGDEWMLNASAERFHSPTLFYVFVRLHDAQPTQFHIVPSPHVAKYVRERHAGWLQTRGKRGKPHRDNPLRKFADPTGQFRNAWHLLGLRA